jgi:DNA-binding transcriptional MerR regulator
MPTSSTDKAPGALRAMGEVVAETGVPAHVLRYWEAHVPALRPVRRAGGRRYFRTEDVALVRRLKQLTDDQGYTLEGAARVVRRGSGNDEDNGAVPVALAATGALLPRPGTSMTLAPDVVAKLGAIRARLAAALARG